MREEHLTSEAQSFLAGCEAFADLPPELRGEIASRMEQWVFDRDEVLIHQGVEGDSMMVLLSGTAVTALRRVDGTLRPIAELHAGEVVGEMALLTRQPRTAEVMAKEEVHVLRLAARDFEELAYMHPQLGMVITALVAKRLGEHAQDGLGGKQVGDFRIVRPVGRGAMAVVYEAECEKRGRVALKMMSHRLNYDTGAKARFEREADMLGGLDHENLATVYDLFSAFETRFIAMEFCDGVDLADCGRLEEDDVRRIVGQLAVALEYIHGRGVTHRDLKPSNVMLTRDGLVKLTDFGLAKPVDGVLDHQITQGRCVVGTPIYMAPEQLSGDPYDERADYYSLGCVALELLSGEPPFDVPNFLKLLAAKLKFSLPSATDIGTGVSSEMYDFISACLEQDPEDRDPDLSRAAQWAGPVDFGLIRRATGRE